MIDYDQLLLFAGASLVLLVVPGPAILYLVAESLDRGRASGIAAASGLTAGNLVHVVAAGVGLSALLATSALAFGVLKYAGAGYLVILGVKQLLDRRRTLREGSAEVEDTRGTGTVPADRTRRWHSFRRGLVVNVLNPKVALFFLAFFPQFVDPSRGNASLQLLLLGLLFLALTLMVNVTYVVTAATVADLFRRRSAGRGWTVAKAGAYLPGVTYIALGVTAALAPVERR